MPLILGQFRHRAFEGQKLKIRKAHFILDVFVGQEVEMRANGKEQEGKRDKNINTNDERLVHGTASELEGYCT